MAKTRMPEGAKELKAKAAVVSRDKICTNCLGTIHRGEWVVECDCGRKYDMDCSFDIMTCPFCGADFFELELDSREEKVSIDRYIDHVNRYYEQLDEPPVGRTEEVVIQDVEGSSERSHEPEIERGSPVKVRLTSPVASEALGPGLERWNVVSTTFRSVPEMTDYCEKTVGIQSSFLLEAMRARIDADVARGHHDRAKVALSSNDLHNTLEFIKKCDKEIRSRIIEAINGASQLMKDLERDGANIRIMQNLIMMSFSSFEAGKILGSLYYLRRIHEETERMKRSADPASYLKDEDYYSIVGVDKDAPFELIRKGYRRKIAPLHPDRHAMSDEETRRDAEERAKVLNRAYNTLKHSQERRLYDIAMGFTNY